MPHARLVPASPLLPVLLPTLRLSGFPLLAGLLLAVPPPATAAETPAAPAARLAPAPFLVPAQVDLMRLLPPPPADASDEHAAEMAEVLALQANRGAARVAQALRDHSESPYDMFRGLLGEDFTAARLPQVTRLAERLAETEEVVVGAAKRGFGRRRPFLANPRVQPVLPLSGSGSYPSGHATRGTLLAIVLSAMVPERGEALFGRVREYAESRIIGGVHFRSDVAGGMRAGTAIAAVLFNDPAFQAEFAPARQELRTALGLPP